MSSAMIGNLAVNLTMETAAFQKAANLAEKRAQALRKQMQGIGDGMASIGKNMSAFATVPIIGFGTAAIKMAGDFEASLGRVGISTQATAGEMVKMRELALEIGKTTSMSASSSADAMDMLAKSGMSATDILGGAARATVALAEATGSKLDPAASAITDTMAQFNKKTSDLPKIINNITGAVNESKFGFSDFAGGMAQAGGVASSAGLSFDEFTAALAATSSQFASGSDAGTSMKTFLLALSPATDKAAKAMQKAGFSAYTASGDLKPLSEIAEELKKKFGDLSEQDMTATFKQMFGTDAIRTAIGLMKAGGAGVEDMQAKIAKTDASKQAAQRMKGFNAELEKLKGALETLAIRMADSGLLSSLTSLVQATGDMVDRMSEASPEMFRFAIGAAAVVAALGPILIVLGPIVSLIGTAVKTFIAWKAGLAAASLAAGGFTPLLVGMLPALAALGVAVAAGYVIWREWDSISGIFTTIGEGLGILTPATQQAASLIAEDFAKISDSAVAAGQITKASASELQTALSNMAKSGKIDNAVLDSYESLIQKMIATGKISPEEAAKVVASIKSMKDAATASGDYPELRAIADGIKKIGEASNDLENNLEDMLSDSGTNLVMWAERARLAFNRGIEYASTMASGIRASYVRLIAYTANMVSSISSWIGNKLAAVWDGAKRKIAEVVEMFNWMDNEVVRNSYVPDMVDGIAFQMNRLDAVMVDKADDATKKTTKTFKDMAADIAPLLNRLFPEVESLEKYRKELGLIADATKIPTGQGGLSEDQANEARRRLQNENFTTDQDLGVEKFTSDDLLDLNDENLNTQIGDFIEKMNTGLFKPLKSNSLETVQNFSNMAEGIVSSFAGVVQSIKSGGFIGILESVAGLFLQMSSTGVFGKTIQGRVNTPGRVRGGNVTSNRTFMVGERGPELFTPNRTGYITPNNKMNHGGRASSISIVPSPYFNAVVDGRADGRVAMGAPGIATAAASGIQTNIQQSNFRTIP